MKRYLLKLIMVTLSFATEESPEIKSPSDLIALSQKGSYTFSPVGASDMLKTLQLLLAPNEAEHQDSLEAIIGKTSAGQMAKDRHQRSSLIHWKSYTVTDEAIPLKTEGLKVLEMAGNISIKTTFSIPSLTASLINGVVAKDTHGLIQKILSETELHPNTSLILLNTLYVKTAWKYPLRQKKESLSFNFTGNEYCNVRASYGLINCPIYETEDTYFIGLETEEKALHMVFKLDKKGYGTAPITPKELDHFQKNKSYRYISLTLPHGAITSSLDLKTILSSQISLLTPHTWFNSIISDQKATVSLLKQVATVEWDEQGFSGAAATVAAIGLTSVRNPAEKEIIIDRPFSFAFIQETTRTPLVIFEGSVRDMEGIIAHHKSDRCYGYNPIDLPPIN